MKCSYIEVNGKGRLVYKDPITDKGKKSMKGILMLEKDGNKYYTRENIPTHWKKYGTVADGNKRGYTCCMKTVFKDGALYGTNLDNIRGRIEKTMISQRLTNFSKDVMPELRLPPTMNSQRRPVSATV